MGARPCWLWLLVALTNRRLCGQKHAAQLARELLKSAAEKAGHGGKFTTLVEYEALESEQRAEILAHVPAIVVQSTDGGKHTNEHRQVPSGERFCVGRW